MDKRRKRNGGMRMGLKVILTAAAVLVAGLFGEIWREIHHFRTVTYPIRSKKLAGTGEGIRVVFLSDLHNQAYGRGNERLIRKIKEADPALVLIGGDMLVGKKDSSYAPALEFVTALAGQFPVYYANGNHEQRMKENPKMYRASYAEYKRALEQAGVHFLENSSQELLCKGQRIKLNGLEIPAECYGHFKKYPLSEGAVKDRLGVAVKEDYEILLAHNPAYMEEYLDWGADLVLSGHLHGGIVRLPGGFGAVSPAFDLFPKYSGGHYREGDTDIVVSKGLGVHTISVRLFNPAELIVLELSGEDEE